MASLLKGKLSDALRQGDLNEFQQLVAQHNVNPHTTLLPFTDAGRNQLQATPFVVAASYGHLHIMKHLLRTLSSQDPASTEDWEFTDEQRQYIETAVDQFYRKTAVLWAAENGHLEVLKWFAQHDVQAKEHVGTRHNSTAVALAAEYGHLETVKWLVKEAGCDPVNQRDGDGDNALLCACGGGWVDIVAFLVKECGCDPRNDRNTDGLTPLLQAVNWQKLDVAKWLVTHGGCDPRTEKDNRGNMALFWAVRRQCEPLLRWLVGECGCDPTVRHPGHMGMPLFHVYVRGAASAEMVRWLVEEHGVDPLELNGKWSSLVNASTVAAADFLFCHALKKLVAKKNASSVQDNTGQDRAESVDTAGESQGTDLQGAAVSGDSDGEDTLSDGSVKGVLMVTDPKEFIQRQWRHATENAFDDDNYTLLGWLMTVGWLKCFGTCLQVDQGGSSVALQREGNISQVTAADLQLFEQLFEEGSEAAMALEERLSDMQQVPTALLSPVMVGTLRSQGWFTNRLLPVWTVKAHGEFPVVVQQFVKLLFWMMQEKNRAAVEPFFPLELCAATAQFWPSDAFVPPLLCLF